MKNIPLTVYKASAGSGKTFTLATEYIKLLIANPLCFKNILAVTFTNKATEEMKSRILSQLYGIWRNLPDSQPYLNVITHDLNISREHASNKAEEALKLLIHNYNYFRVETIDSFFQSVLRNLARELDLTPNLKTSLNDYEVEEEAVDRLIESLTTSSKMLNWLLKYINSNIDNNKSWNIVNQLKEFGHTIFSDFYKKASEKLNEAVNTTGFFEQYNNVLRTLADEAEKAMTNYSDKFDTALRKADITPDNLSGKRKGIYSYFEKLRSNDFSNAKCINKTLEKHLCDAENWIPKSNKDRDRLIDIVNNTLMPILKKAENDRQHMWRNYCSAMQTLKHLYKVRLLSSIESKVRELNNDANRFLLSDTQYLLNELIEDTDTPFVFEKIGCQLKHIMIDEFQDTSTVQWQNFKVLLKECMSHNDYASMESKYTGIISNLIVGDVKQSIYRWRAGDWRLLNSIESQLQPYHDTIEVKSLVTNYRSKGNIIEFNNRFFELAAKYEYEKEKDLCDEKSALQIKTAYCDVVQQKRKDEHEGLVRVCLFDSEDFDLDMMKHIERCIDDILETGAKMGDIAILVRFNRHIPAIAEYFMTNRPELMLISDEAFRLNNSNAVRIIIKALVVISDSNNTLARTALAQAYQKDILGRNSMSESVIIDMSNDPALTDAMLPEEFTNNINSIAAKPLQDMVEDIFNAFKLYELDNESAYICAFCDCVQDFTTTNMDSVAAFIKEWNDRLSVKTIQSDGIDAIRLLSIHKSKGLEFDNVIIPYCDWKLGNRRNTLWCKPNQSPYNELSIVPVDYSKKLLETIYDNDYREEHMQTIVDNLNLLYVAMTRAGNNLFILGRSNTNQEYRSEIIERCLPELEAILPDAVYHNDETKQEIFFEFGNLHAENQPNKQKKSSSNVFLKPETAIGFTYCKRNKTPIFRQSNQSSDFIAGEDDNNNNDNYIKIGCILHRLFSLIKTERDIDDVLTQFEFEGILYDNGLTAEKIKTMLKDRLEDKRVASWFSDKWKVFNECSILSTEVDKVNRHKVIEHRPDRVITDGNTTIVIDFKFGKPNSRYVRQVAEYMSLLTNMGHKNVKGYIWFVYSNKIEEVNGCKKDNSNI